MSPEQRGEEAARILSSPLWEEAWSAFDAATLEEWEGTLAEQTEIRERLWRMRHAAREVREMLENMITEGKEAIRARGNQPGNG